MADININNLAQQIYTKLNAQDGINDDKIGLKSDGSYDNSIWNNFANEAGGSQVKNYIKGDNALKSIRTYLQRAMNDAAKLAKIALAGGVQIEGAEEAQATPEQREIPESITKDFEDAKANVRAQMYDCFGGLPQAEAIRPLMGLVETPVTESLAAEIVVPQLVTAEEAVMPEAEPGNVYEEFSEEPSQLVVAKEVVSEYETGGIYGEISDDGTEYSIDNNDGTISITKDGETVTRPMTDEEKALDPQQLVANLEAAKAAAPQIATAEVIAPKTNTGAVLGGFADNGTGVSINFEAGTVTIEPESGELQTRNLTDDEKQLSPEDLLTKLINDVNTPPVSDVEGQQVQANTSDIITAKVTTSRQTTGGVLGENISSSFDITVNKTEGTVTIASSDGKVTTRDLTDDERNLSAKDLIANLKAEVKASETALQTEAPTVSKVRSEENNLSSDDQIKSDIRNLKSGESYQYVQTTRGVGFATRGTVNVERQEDGSLVETRAGRLNTATYPYIKSVALETVYDENYENKVSEEFVDKDKPQWGVKSTRFYNEIGERTHVETDLKNADPNYDVNSMVLSLGHASRNTYSNQTIYDSNGEVLFEVRGGKYYSSKGKEIDMSKAMDKLNKAMTRGTVGKLVQEY